MVTISQFPDLKFEITRPMGQPYIRREFQKDYSIRVYLDIDQYILCHDEVIAEYLDLFLQTFGKKLRGMTKEKIIQVVEIPQDHAKIVKIVGEKIVLQLRERDLLRAQDELLKRMDEIVLDLYGDIHDKKPK